MINTDHPMGAARYVRRERYAWPGGYPLVLVMRDGGILCADCVRDEFHLISSGHRDEWGRDWKPLGMQCIYEAGEYCDHCGKEIYGEDE